MKMPSGALQYVPAATAEITNEHLVVRNAAALMRKQAVPKRNPRN